ncbi:ABC transporter permease [Salinicola peritrichatus]|uniref:ABC transporter permease n=1 Tax=Salinicola peritrichatus TaxID=1267424 RepID=UPI0013A65A6B|nr:ABC transporter permease [Salinicola peritrichatus]
MNVREVHGEAHLAQAAPAPNKRVSNTTTPATSRKSRPTLPQSYRQLLEKTLLPLLVIAIFLCLWEALVTHFQVSVSLLPPPSYIYTRLTEVWTVLLNQAVPTTLETIASFCVATALGIVLASILTYSRLLNSAFYPIIVFFQLIPKIALAPLFVVWMGISSQSRIEFATFMAFFPIVVSTMAGLRATPPDMLRLCKGLTANSWQIFTLVRLPYAIPHIFSGMKVAVTLAMIGVIVAEFISAPKGLGYLIVFASSQADTALILSAILFLCIIGLALYGVVALLEYVVTRRYG